MATSNVPKVSSLPIDFDKEAQAAHDEHRTIEQAQGNVVRVATILGKRLLRVRDERRKKRLKWLPWLEKQARIPRRSAQIYMQLGKHAPLIERGQFLSIREALIVIRNALRTAREERAAQKTQRRCASDSEHAAPQQDAPTTSTVHANPVPNAYTAPDDSAIPSPEDVPAPAPSAPAHRSPLPKTKAQPTADDIRRLAREDAASLRRHLESLAAPEDMLDHSNAIERWLRGR